MFIPADAPYERGCVATGPTTEHDEVELGRRRDHLFSSAGYPLKNVTWIAKAPRIKSPVRADRISSVRVLTALHGTARSRSLRAPPPVVSRLRQSQS